MRRIWLFLTDSRNLTIAGFIAMAVLFYLGAELLQLALIWALAALAAVCLAWLLMRWLSRRRAARATAGLVAAMAPAETPVHAVPASRQEVDAVRSGMLKAIATIKGSKLGRMPGSRALYELPWYMIIGNPSAGKSSAIIHSGLQFPFADARAVHGVGGTRNCDWFFTADGIVLDTAGRYAVEDEHQDEWRGFLDLLKKHRKRAPVNGIIVAVSVAELRSDPDGALKLARSLRKRVQDLIERLEVYAPVYVLFTKADLIAGFSDFFCQCERSERERVWGATMPYKRKAGSEELLAFFDQGFDELHAGLRGLVATGDKLEVGQVVFERRGLELHQFAERGQQGGKGGQRPVHLLLPAHEAEGRMGDEADAAPFLRQGQQRVAYGHLNDRVGQKVLAGQMFQSLEQIALHRAAGAADGSGTLKLPEPCADFFKTRPLGTRRAAGQTLDLVGTDRLEAPGTGNALHLRLETRCEGEQGSRNGLRETEQGRIAHRQDAALGDDAKIFAAMLAESIADDAFGL
eukprot:gene37435-46181_t